MMKILRKSKEGSRKETQEQLRTLQFDVIRTKKLKEFREKYPEAKKIFEWMKEKNGHMNISDKEAFLKIKELLDDLLIRTKNDKSLQAELRAIEKKLREDFRATLPEAEQKIFDEIGWEILEKKGSIFGQEIYEMRKAAERADELFEEAEEIFERIRENDGKVSKEDQEKLKEISKAQKEAAKKTGDPDKILMYAERARSMDEKYAALIGRKGETVSAGSNPELSKARETQRWIEKHWEYVVLWMEAEFGIMLSAIAYKYIIPDLGAGVEKLLHSALKKGDIRQAATELAKQLEIKNWHLLEECEELVSAKYKLDRFKKGKLKMAEDEVEALQAMIKNLEERLAKKGVSNAEEAASTVRRFSKRNILIRIAKKPLFLPPKMTRVRMEQIKRLLYKSIDELFFICSFT